jgi:Curlin associated repeat
MPPLHLLLKEVVIRTRLSFLVLGCLAISMSAAYADDTVMINQAVNAAVASGRNISTINQTGSNNFAETDQFGSQNSATISQLGNSNQSTIIQNATGAIAVDNQFGNGNQITIRQTGPNPQPITITQRR